MENRGKVEGMKSDVVELGDVVGGEEFPVVPLPISQRQGGDVLSTEFIDSEGKASSGIDTAAGEN